MDLIELRAIVEAERSAAIGRGSSSSSRRSFDDDLATQRATNMDAYLGDMTRTLPAPEGRSAVVSTDVSDTVDGLMPDLMDIFTGTDQVVIFDPVGPDDEDAAKQETEYVNYIFYKENAGFVVLHSMFKDALIQKNGIAKFWWEETDNAERETYRSLPDDAFAMLTADKSVELIEHTAIPGPEGIIHDAVVIKTKPYGCVKILAVPPEEFVIARDARTIKDARYCAHKTKKTQSQLIEMGYSKATVEDLADGDEVETDEELSRNTVGDAADNEAAALANKAMRSIEVWEHYIRVDWDGDGIAELRKVTQAGAKILDNEEFDAMPFASITPILMSHRFSGRAVADLVLEIQKVNTALDRSLLDNIYFMNNQRMEIAESHASENTLDDYLTNRPGSPVRTKQPGGLIPIPSVPIVQHILPVREFWDQKRETRTGVQRYAAGPDANTLNPYTKTLGGANLVANAGQKRIRLIARIFAETGIKDLMLGIHATMLKHGKDARTVKLGNQWVTIDPREWKTRKSMSPNVGLGTGSRDQQQQQLMAILGLQIKGVEMQMAAGKGLTGPLFNAENIHYTFKKLVENSGYNNAEPFVMEPGPEASQPQPPPPDPNMVKVQAQIQLDQLKFQHEREMAMEKNAMERQQMQAEYELKVAELRAEIELAQQKAAVDVQLKTQDQAVKHELAAQDTASKAEERKKPPVAIEGFDARISAAESGIGEKLDRLDNGLSVMGNGLSDLARAIAAPKNVRRGPDGKVAGVDTVL